MHDLRHLAKVRGVAAGGGGGECQAPSATTHLGPWLQWRPPKAVSFVEGHRGR